MCGEVLLTMTDQEAVSAALEAGVGGKIAMRLGGKISRGFFRRLYVVGVVTYVGSPVNRAYSSLSRRCSNKVRILRTFCCR